MKYVLDYGMVEQEDGSKKRKQISYETKEQAIGARDDAKAKRRAHGDRSLALSEADRILFVQCRDKLAALGATIGEAVSFFLDHRTTARPAPPLRDLLTEFENDKRRRGKSERYLQQLRCSCLSFIRGRELQLADSVTADHVRAWIAGNKWEPKTQRVYLGDLRTLFSYAHALGMVRFNPCGTKGAKGVTRIALDDLHDKPIGTMYAVEVGRLLFRCVLIVEDPREDFRELLAYLALGFFCGIRPAELSRLDWSEINLVEAHVVVSSGKAKTRRRRVVDIPPNCLAWLVLAPVKHGRIAPKNFRKRWEALRRATKAPWSHDVMRHTFASAHYAVHQNEALLKAQLGHSGDEDVLFRHYRALTTRAEAARFWSVAPVPWLFN